MAWIIQNKNDSELAWSNSWGWCSDSYETFSDTEKETLSLPIEGEWIEVCWRKIED
jgi:hypothetical protein